MEKFDLIVVGNSGSFFSEFKEFIRLYHDRCRPIYLELKVDFDYIDQVGQFFAVHVSQMNCKYSIIYIGGEVRRSDKMDMANYDVPKLLVNINLGRLKSFIYLSSLAALPEHSSGLISPCSAGNPDPRSLYGVSKRRFDDWILSNTDGIIVGRVVPASIIGSKYSSSSLHRICRISSAGILFRIFDLKTYISFCTRVEVYEALKNCLNLTSSLSIVVAQNALVSDINYAVKRRRGLIQVPSLVPIVAFLYPCLPYRFARIVRGLFNEALYGQCDGRINHLGRADLIKFIDQNSILK